MRVAARLLGFVKLKLQIINGNFQPAGKFSRDDTVALSLCIFACKTMLLKLTSNKGIQATVHGYLPISLITIF